MLRRNATVTGGEGTAQSPFTLDEELPLADLLGEELPLAEEVDEGFLLAPDESHVQAMRYSEQGEATYIDVRFKPNGNSGVTQYRYTFGPGGRDFAKMIYHEMSGSAHPGVDIWAYLIRGGIPYQKTALS